MGESIIRNLNTEEYDWNTVLGGHAICAPQLTSYGFVVLTDGRMLSGFAENGMLLWQVAVRGKPKNYLAVTPEDFIFVITNNSYLNMINSNGVILWSVDTGFEITEAPLQGDDGRIFIKGKDTIACYGINGIRKWKLRTSSLSSVPLCLLNDGTILVFLQSTAALQSEQMQVLRLSPFGEELAYETLNGTVVAAQSCDSGLLLVYNTGTVEFCRIVSSPDDVIGTLFFIWRKEHAVFVHDTVPVVFHLKNGMTGIVSTDTARARISVFFNDAGDLATSFFVPELTATSNLYVQNTTDGICIANDACCYCYRLTIDMHTMRKVIPEITWNTLLPTGTFPWDYVAYTYRGTLVICGKSWEIHGYRVFQDTFEEKRSVTGLVYQHFYQMPFDNEDSIAVDERLLEKGDYALLEIPWVNELKHDMKQFYSKMTERVSNVSAPISFQEVEKNEELVRFALTSLFGTSVFQKQIVSMALKERDPAYLCMYIRIMAQNGYDPEGRMLDALELIMGHGAFNQNQVCIALCDAVYKICYFMGNRSMNIKGQGIVSAMTSKKYSKQVNEYARNILFLFASLDRTL
ncbi:MAG: hypothetical protein K6E51_09885 [Treponema sp.]|nr:hypothetical protein [Treponema sp.]